MSADHSTFDSHPASRVHNSQPAGIGRVVAEGPVVAWNNLGRNVVFADRRLRPLAVADDTFYPGEDELSQFDLDVHAIAAVPSARLVVVLNHLGLVRAFDRSEVSGPRTGPVRRVRPVWTQVFAEDVERAVVVEDRLVGSGSRAAPTTGIVVSEPLQRSAAGPLAPVRAELGSWGEVTALATTADAGGPALVVGGPGRVGWVPMAGGRARPARWEVDVPFRVAALAHGDGVVWAAGSALSEGIDDHDWERVRGGCVAVLDALDGRVRSAVPLPDDVAWGNGGAPFVVVGGAPCVVARTGEVCVGRAASPGAPDGPPDGAPDSAAGSWRRGPPLAASSLGIAHAAVAARGVLYGFNRGGYRLRAVAAADLPRPGGAGDGSAAAGPEPGSAAHRGDAAGTGWPW